MLWPLLAGTSLAARIRRLTFAIFGLATAAGLALVAFVAQTGYPVLSVAPLPLPGPALTAPGVGVTLGEATGPYAGVTVDLSGIPSLAADGARSTGSASSTIAPLAVDAGLQATTGSGGSTQSGLAAAPGKSGLSNEQHSEVTAVTPAQQPTTPPEPALADAPVSGSSPSSGLFVRSSVAPGLGEDGEVATSAPVAPDEPEIPYEPELPVEPEVPVEPELPVEPEVPVEPPVEPPAEEDPADGDTVSEPPPAAEAAPEAPVG